MYDENGNASNGVTTTTTTIQNESNSPITTGNGTNTQFRPTPSSPASSDASYAAYYSYNLAQQTNGQQMAQPVNRNALICHMMNVKDPTWLQVEVCREFQRGQCSRTEEECKFAHPPPHVEIQNGRVIVCYDSMKNRCNRGTTACKFLHPPAHLKQQVVENGRSNFIWKNWLMAQMSQAHNLSASIAPNMGALGPYAATVSPPAPTIPTGMTTFNPYAPYNLNSPPAMYQNVMVAPSPDPYGNISGVLTGAVSAPSAMPVLLQEQGQTLANVRTDRPEFGHAMSTKRSSMDKVGVAVIQPMGNPVNGGTPLQCPQFLPAFPPFTSYVPVTFTGQVPTVPRM